MFGLEKNKLAPSESKLVLNAMLIVLKTQSGFSQLQALTFCEELFSNKKRIKDILSKMNDEISSGTLGTAEAFELYGLLTSLESAKYASSSKHAYESLKSIFDERKYTNRFEPAIKWFFIKVFIAFTLVFFALMYFEENLKAQFIERYIASGIKNPIESLPFWIENTYNNFYFLLGFAFVFLYVRYWYLKTYHNQRKTIYKLFSLKSYDDTTIMFQTMRNFFKTLKKHNEVFKKMKNLSCYSGLVKMFEDLEDASLDSDGTFFDIFDKYNFPKEVTVLVQVNESGEFLDNLDGIIEYTQEVSIQKFSRYKATFDFLSTYIPIFIIVGAVMLISAELSSNISMTNLRGF